MQFESPWALLLLPVVALLPLVRYWAGRARRGLRFSSAAVPGAVRPSFRRRLVAVPQALLVLALALLVVALARPREGQEQVVDVSRGIAIELVLDRSSSMGLPLGSQPQSASRLDVAKEVLGRFVHGDGAGLTGRADDMIGLVTFARYANTILPLTLAHGAVDGFLPGIELAAPRGGEDGTALGDAIALAAARLQLAEEELRARAGTGADATAADTGETATYEIKSKVMVVLTDGRNNTGERTPLEAAGLARDWGITVHAVGLGGGEMDATTLRAIAEATGGLFRTAADPQALHAVYREIDQLETSELESIRYLSYRERFVPLALAALACAALAALLGNTVLRRSP